MLDFQLSEEYTYRVNKRNIPNKGGCNERQAIITEKRGI